MTETWKQWEGQTVQGVFDNYEIGQPMGGREDHAVFQTARGPQRNQKAAIKLIPLNEAESEAAAERWLSRWKLSAKLSHSHLLGLYDMGRCRVGSVEMVFAVMESADEDLSQILPERALAPEEAMEMLLPALEALGYLHRQGLVHGHIKPANIMAVGNQVKLSCDGLCRAGEKGYAGDRPGAYDPPEKAGDAMSTAADVWSLGVTLIEVITQKAPVWDRTGGDDPVVPPTLPHPFLDIARRCLRRDPQARSSIAEIAAQLRPPTAPPQAPPQPRRARRSLMVPMAVGALAVAAMAGGWQWMQSRPGSHEVVTVEMPESKAETPGVLRASSSAPARVQTPAREAARPSPAHPVAHVSAVATPAPERAITLKAAGGDRTGVVQEVIPEVPKRALNSIHGKIQVNVRVNVEPSGSVADAELELSGPSEYFKNLTLEEARGKYFAKLALQAAQAWKFAPGEEDGMRNWQLEFMFTNSEAGAVAKRMAR